MSKIRYIKNNYLVETIILIFAAFILINTLFINPVLGRYNNGDFERLIIYGGLKNISNKYKDMYDKFLHINYLISYKDIFYPIYTNWVSEAIILKISVFIFLIIHGFNSHLFDIRYLAFVYSVLFLLGIFLIIKSKIFTIVVKITIGVFIILFFTSACYITYFNSFFGEAGTIVFFFITIGTYLNLITKKSPNIRDFIYFFIASGGFLTSKPQVLPLLFFMLFVYMGLYMHYKESKYRKNIILCSVIVTFVCIFSYFSLSNTMNENNLYQSVFLGVLKDSKTPQEDLQGLGINKKFIAFYGHSFYDKKFGLDPMGEEMLKEFYPNVSFGKILAFYLKHSDRIWEKIVSSASNAYNFSQNNNYNFSDIDEHNFIKGQYTSHKYVNNFRIKLIELFPHIHRNIYIFISFSSIYLLILIYYFIKKKHTRLLILMLLFILISGSSQLILPVIGSGYGDFGKHLFLLNFSYDIMLGISLLWIVHIISKLILFIKRKDSRCI